MIIEMPKNIKQIAVLAFIEIKFGFRLFRIDISNIQPIITRMPTISDIIPAVITIALRYDEILKLIRSMFCRHDFIQF